MHVWMLLLIATASPHTVTVHEVFKTEKLCKAEGQRADKIATEVKGVTIKWACKPATPVANPGN